MKISDIRRKAWVLRQQTPGIYLLFSLPALLAVANSLLALTDQIGLVLPDMSFSQALVYFISRSLFPTTVRFLLSLFLLSASFSLIELVRHQRDSVGLADISRVFAAGTFGPVFSSLLVKQLLLFLWNLPSLAGSFLTIFNSYKVLAIVNSLQEPRVLTPDSPQAAQVLQYAPGLFLGFILIIAGLALAIPQYYAYSQADFILYDRLTDGSYQGPIAVLRQSRQLMKGFKWQRFLLDLTFIGWMLLSGLTYSLLSLLVYPYTHAAAVYFYEEVKQEKGLN